MLSFEQMPENNADLATIEVSFPYLEPNTEANCPRDASDIQRYLKLEDGDGEKVSHRSLEFLRTAQVADSQFWIWRYHESDGQECYVTVELMQDGSDCLGMDWNLHSLTPEQFMLGTYHNVF